MKYLKTYEGIRDKMTPKSKEEIRKSFGYMSASDKLFNGIDLNIIWLVQEGIDEGADVNKDIHLQSMHTFGEIYSLIELACFRGNIDIIKLLLDNGVIIDKYNFDRCLKQTKYFNSDNYKEVENLLNQYDKMNESIRDKMTPKSEEEILKSLEDKSPIEKLLKGIQNKSKFIIINAIKDGTNIDDLIKVLNNSEFREFGWKIKSDYLDIMNESIRDKMTPKSEEEIRTATENLVKNTYPNSQDKYNELMKCVTLLLDNKYKYDYIDTDKVIWFIYNKPLHFVSLDDLTEFDELEKRLNKYKIKYNL